MSAIDPLREEDELLAAELAFGLLDGDDRAATEALVARDVAFAAAYRRWQTHAAALLDGPDETPRPSIWSAIERRLPANDVAPPADMRRELRWWRGGTLAASAAAAVLAVVAIQRPATVVTPPPVAAPATAPLVAVLTGAKGIVSVSYDRASGRLTTAPASVEIGAHAAELWVIPADGTPRSLGVIVAVAPGWTRAPALAAPALAPGATLAITIEPIGGSPTGKPTGPVILSGKMTTT